MRLEKWNPTIKMVTVLIAVILLSVQYNILLNVVIVAVSLLSLLFFSEVKVKRIITLLIPAIIAAWGLFVMGLYYARENPTLISRMSDISTVPYMVRAALSTNGETALQLSTRLLAYAGLGMVFALTTEGEYFVRSLMHQCRLSPKFAYGILAAFYLLPIMIQEFRNVQLAFRVRNMSGNGLRPAVIFAMLVNSIRWSESIAMAMESKGFCGNAARTYVEIPRVRWHDLVIAVLIVGGILAPMIIELTGKQW